MRRLLLLTLLPALLAADDHWVQVHLRAIRSPHRRRPARRTRDDGALSRVPPRRRTDRRRARIADAAARPHPRLQERPRVDLPAPISEGRDRYNIVLQEKGAVSPAVYSELTRLFLQSNTAQMPPHFERGLIAFFSTFDVSGIHITVGAPPPQPDLDWARIHLLVTDPEYFGKIRVLLANLRRGVDEEPAYRNAFAQIAAPTSTRRRNGISPPAISRRPRSTAVRWRSAISPSGPSPTPTPNSRAPTCSPGKQSTAEYQALLKDRVKIAESRGRARPAGLARRSEGRGAAALLARDAGGQRKRPLLTSSTPSSSPTTKRPPRRCSRPPASTPNSTSRSS